MTGKIVMPDGQSIWMEEDGRMAWTRPDKEGVLIRPFYGAEKELLTEALRLRDGLADIAGHSVCCDARHCADKVLAGLPVSISGEKLE